MQIAVLGWGSLIWCPGSLRIKSRWYRDGPRLPIEFARISSDRRLTLVIHAASPKKKTYWAISEFGYLKQACENLRTREETSEENIHWIKANPYECGPKVQKKNETVVQKWMQSQRGKVDAVIWTGLESNWATERKKQFTVKDAVAYLSELEMKEREAKNVLKHAKEYLTNTPSQIQTKVRDKMKKKRWIDNQLSKSLFEN